MRSLEDPQEDWRPETGKLGNSEHSQSHALESTAYSSGFPDSSVGKEFACNAGDPGSILGSGRSTGEGIGYPFQYSWASPVAQLVKNSPAMRETWVQSLGWEDPLEKGMATTPVFWPGEFHGLYMYSGVTKSQTLLSGFHFFIDPVGTSAVHPCGSERSLLCHHPLEDQPGEQHVD